MTFAQFTVYAVAVSTGIVNTILAVLVLKKDPRNIRNIVLALYITFLNLVLQVVSFIIVFVGNNLEATQFTMKFGQLVLFIPFILYIFARIYISGTVTLKHWLFLAPYFAIITIASLFYTNHLFMFEWSDIAGYYIILPNKPLYGIMLLAYTYLAIATYFFYTELKKETVPIRRTRLKYLLLSPFFPAIGFLLITFPSIHILPWDMIGTTISTVMLAYVVVEHELLEIRVAIKESLIYTFFTIGVMALFTLLSYIAIAFSHDPSLNIFNPITFFAILITTSTLYIIYRRGKETAKLLEDERLIRDQIMDMVAKTSHNLRTPLTAINGYLESLTKKSGKLSADMIYDITAISANTLRMALHTENLLAYSQIMYERHPLNTSNIEINQVVQSAAKQYEPLVNHRGLTLVIQPYKETLTVIGENQYVRLAVQNLVANAIQFTSQGNITLVITREASVARITVTDTGAGITQEVLHSLSDPSALSNAVSRGGAGIGLHIVDLIARRQNGEFGADSTIGIGSSFWFTLPLYD